MHQSFAITALPLTRNSGNNDFPFFTALLKALHWGSRYLLCVIASLFILIKFSGVCLRNIISIAFTIYPALRVNSLCDCHAHYLKLSPMIPVMRMGAEGDMVVTNDWCITAEKSFTPRCEC